MKIELLITQSSKTIFCKDKKSLTHLLQSDNRISIVGTKLKYSDVEFKIEILTLKASSKEHQCFKMNIQTSEDNIEKLSSLRDIILYNLKAILGNTTQIIWDDTDTFYSEKAYLPIKEIENLMRKFLTQFYLINVGLEWVKETIPNQMEPKLERNASKSASNYLAETDFKDLSDILFLKYTKHEITSIFEKIKLAKTPENIKEITEMLPSSNWERYFKKHIDCDDKQLEKNWGKLYILRCKVAHNKSFTKRDLEELEELAAIVKPTIEKSIEKLELIEITEEEKETIILSSIANKNENISELSTRFKNGAKKHNDKYMKTLFDIEKKLMRTPSTFVKTRHINTPSLNDLIKSAEHQYRVVNVLDGNNFISFTDKDHDTSKYLNELLNAFNVSEHD
ncbi:TPA: hypothetical protein ACKP24_002857, partial [Serratia marcescens]